MLLERTSLHSSIVKEGSTGELVRRLVTVGLLLAFVYICSCVSMLERENVGADKPPRLPEHRYTPFHNPLSPRSLPQSFPHLTPPTAIRAARIRAGPGRACRDDTASPPPPTQEAPPAIPVREAAGIRPPRTRPDSVDAGCPAPPRPDGRGRPVLRVTFRPVLHRPVRVALAGDSDRRGADSSIPSAGPSGPGVRIRCDIRVGRRVRVSRRVRVRHTIAFIARRAGVT